MLEMSLDPMLKLNAISGSSGLLQLIRTIQMNAKILIVFMIDVFNVCGKTRLANNSGRLKTRIRTDFIVDF